MTWRDQLQQHYPDGEPPELAYNAAAAHQGAAAYLAQEYEPHLQVQETFWKSLTECLGAYGRLAYEPPNFDQPAFTTGHLALEEIDINAYGESRPIPCIKLALHENSFIYNYFKRRTMYPRLYRWYERDARQAATAAIRQYYEEQGTAGPHLPYIEMEAKLVSLAGVREATVYHRTAPIRGAYIPGVLLKRDNLPIFPETPPPNYKSGYGYTPNWVRLGPPRSPDLVLPDRDPLFDQTFGGYENRLRKWSGDYMQQRDRDMDSLHTFIDILRTARQVDMRADDHFERIAAAKTHQS